MTDSSAWTLPGLSDSIGLCAACRHVRMIGNARGSTFYLCRLSDDDPRYPKYPRLPVLRCSGFEVVSDESGPTEDR